MKYISPLHFLSCVTSFSIQRRIQRRICITITVDNEVKKDVTEIPFFCASGESAVKRKGAILFTLVFVSLLIPWERETPFRHPSSSSVHLSFLLALNSFNGCLVRLPRIHLILVSLLNLSRKFAPHSCSCIIFSLLSLHSHHHSFLVDRIHLLLDSMDSREESFFSILLLSLTSIQVLDHKDFFPFSVDLYFKENSLLLL